MPQLQAPSPHCPASLQGQGAGISKCIAIGKGNNGRPCVYCILASLHAFTRICLFILVCKTQGQLSQDILIKAEAHLQHAIHELNPCEAEDLHDAGCLLRCGCKEAEADM